MVVMLAQQCNILNAIKLYTKKMIKMVNCYFMYIIPQFKTKMIVLWLTGRERMHPLFSNLDHSYIW